MVPVTSSCTPVSTGVTSSREAANATWAIAVAKSSAGTRPESPVTSGIAGYSATGIDARVNRADPQVSRMPSSSSTVISIGAFGKRLAISDSRRPWTRIVPGSSTVASIVVRADAS